MRTLPTWLLASLPFLLVATSCRSHRGASRQIGVIRSAVSQADGSQPSESRSALDAKRDCCDAARYVGEGRVFNNVFYFSASSINKARLGDELKPPGHDETRGWWSNFQFDSNLYCNSSDLSTCQPDAAALKKTGFQNPEDPAPDNLHERQGTTCGAAGNEPCDPQFLSFEGYPIDSSSPAKFHYGVSLTAGSPNSVYEFAGGPIEGGALAVEDLVGVCYASSPARGAREVP